jgi:hypothetical protein
VARLSPSSPTIPEDDRLLSRLPPTTPAAAPRCWHRWCHCPGAIAVLGGVGGIVIVVRRSVVAVTSAIAVVIIGGTAKQQTNKPTIDGSGEGVAVAAGRRWHRWSSLGGRANGDGPGVLAGNVAILDVVRSWF